MLSIRTDNTRPIFDWLLQRGFEPQELDQQLRVSGPGAAELIAPLHETFGSHLTSLTLGQPGLEDVFIARTERKFEA